jgi:two-component system, cell cycle response regulator DivK
MDVGAAESVRKRLLIVEDSDETRELFYLFFTGKGFTCEGAADGREGLVKARVWRPDVIIMDLHMPRLTGWEAIQRLKANEQTKDLPIVALSATSREGQALAQAVGCDSYCAKPMPLESLLAEVQRALEKARRASGSAEP